MPLFRRAKEKIYHIDHLPEKMKLALKTVMDVNLHDIAKYYGLKYLTPRFGEPIFIPYGELNGKFETYNEAFKKINETIEEVKEDGLKQYKQWYPNVEFLDHYRIVFYSATEYGEGVIYGIGAEPLADLKQSLNLEDDDITVVGMGVKVQKAKYYDFIKGRKQEIIDAYNYIYREFHEKYDKDKVYVEEVATYYMNKFFDTVNSYFKNLEYTEKLKGEVAVVPLFNSIAKKDGKILDLWREYYKNYFEEGNYYKLEALRAIYNEEFINSILSQVKDNFNKVVLIGEDKKPKVPEVLKDLKVIKEEGNYIVLSR